MRVARLSGDKGCSRHSEARLNRGGLTSKKGFSVVAPMNTTSAVLDGGQEHVLLGLGEAVHLVDEQDGALALLAESAAASAEGLAHVLHAGAGGRERG